LPSDEHLHLSRHIRPIEMFDRIAVEVETHRAIRRVIDDKTRRAAMVGNERRFLHELVRLNRIAHRRLGQIEGDFQPSLGAASQAVEGDLRWTVLGTDKIGVGLERCTPSRLSGDDPFGCRFLNDRISHSRKPPCSE
jgi:hypothetical protein